MHLNRKELAERGEELAAKILADKGYEIIELEMSPSSR